MILKYEPSDTRVVCGVFCTWWSGIEDIGTMKGVTGRHGQPMPCCPHCHKGLFQFDNPGVWWKKMQDYEDNGHPGYRDFISWLKGKCFADMTAAKIAYEMRAGRKVEI